MHSGNRAAAAPESRALRIVAVEDNADDIELIGFALRDAGVAAQLRVADDEPSLRAVLTPEPDLILCDYKLPRFSPQAALALLEQLKLPIPLIVVTRAIGESAAVEVLRLGARDYVAKDRLATLPQVIRRVLDQDLAERAGRILHARLESAHRRLRDMSARMIDVQEDERKRVARELHDVLGQALTSVLMHLESAERMRDGPAAKECRAVATRLVRESLDQVRTLSFMLRPAQLDLLGLAAAVRSAAALQLRPLGIKAELRVRGAVDAASPTQAAVLYRVVQEALTNVVRHAGARHVRLRLARIEPDRFIATIVDDGDGFDVGQTLETPSPGARRTLGLTGMIERCELIGGRLTIRSRPGWGTAVRASV